MSIRVSPASDADMHRVFEVASLAFARNEDLWDHIFPEHWTPSGRQIGGDRMLQIKNSCSWTTFLKAVDPSTNEIIGMAKWNHYNGVDPDVSPSAAKDETNYWKTEDEKLVAAVWGKEFIEHRHTFVHESNDRCLSLDILAIDPSYQRKGVGGALVRWGTAMADEQDVEACVESSVSGKGLYEKNGFVFQYDLTLKNPPGLEAAGCARSAWLIRPRKGAA